MLLLFENCPMKFKTVKKLISCALPAWLLLGSGQNLLGSARFWSVPARFWSVLVGSCYIKYEEELLQRLRIILLKVRSLGLKLNKSKCIFGQSKIKFFGIEISEKGISPDPDKITAIKNAQAPRSVNELRSFLGLCTYVSRFIDSF